MCFSDVDSPVKAMAEAIKCTDLLNGQNVDPNQVSSSVQSILLESQATAPWVEFFTGGLGTRPAKVCISALSSIIPSIFI